MVITGTIRNTDEAEGLSVELSVWPTDVMLRSDGEELGSWPSTAVEVRPLDADSFEFLVEGDRLIFIPDDPAALDATHLVVRDKSRAAKRKRRKSEKEARQSKPPRKQEESRKKSRSRRTPKAKVPSKDKPKERSKKQRTPKEPRAKRELKRPTVPKLPKAPRLPFKDRKAKAARPSRGTAMSQASESDPAQLRPRAASTKNGRVRRSIRTRFARQKKTVEATSENSAEMGNGIWVRTLDVARRFDTFGLDRVPVDESLRGHEHEHTWDHRVAARHGLGTRICTICGKVRVKVDI